MATRNDPTGQTGYPGPVEKRKYLPGRLPKTPNAFKAPASSGKRKYREGRFLIPVPIESFHRIETKGGTKKRIGK